MASSNVFKYGPVEPHHRPCRPFHPLIIKYGPLGPSFPPESMVVKYAPPRPDKPGGMKPEEQEDQEIRFILKQIAECLKSIEGLLRKISLLTLSRQDIKESNAELGSCLAELALLYTKLCELQGSGSNQAMEYKPGRGSGGAVIFYKVIVPARLPKEKE